MGSPETKEETEKTDLKNLTRQELSEFCEDLGLRSFRADQIYEWLYQKGASISLPSTPSLVSPSDGATGQPLTLTLDWSDVSNAESYQVQVSAGSSFASTELDQTKTSSQHGVSSGVLAYNSTYYWRVRATNSGGSSNWSCHRWGRYYCRCW